MKWSVSTVAFYGHSITKALAAIMAAGGTAVDLEYWLKFGLNYDFRNTSSLENLQFIKRLRRFGLEVIGINAHHQGFGSSRHANALLFSKNAVTWGNHLGAQHLTVQVAEDTELNELAPSYFQSLEKLAYYAHHNKLQLLLEVPHPGYGTATLLDIYRLTKIIPQNIGYTVDLAHLERCSIDICQIAPLIAHKVTHLHIRGNSLASAKDLHHAIDTLSPTTCCLELEFSSSVPLPFNYLFKKVSSALQNVLATPPTPTSNFTRQGYDNFGIEYNYCRNQAMADLAPLSKLLKEKTYKWVLDVGCGGCQIGDLLPHDAEIVGIDLSNKLLELACKRLGDRFIPLCIDILDFSPANASFELITVINSLCHIPIALQLPVLNTLLDCTSKNSLVYIVIPSKPVENLKTTCMGHELYCNVLSRDSYACVIESRGLSVEYAYVDSGLQGQREPGIAIIGKKTAANIT
ncbi:MAG: hypothetical protein COA36_17585 [Desulfotalea sp.]|nr:MAG: hypothetical protein COA36_17585 [Desulfotalea sp.]